MVDKIEEQIRKAIEEGKFDNLPGKGKPLNLDENPFEDPEWRMANSILKEAGFSLPWIEARQEFEQDLGKARQDLERAWRRYRQEEAAGIDLLSARSAWGRAVDLFKLRISEINKKISSYNLQTPLDRLQSRLLNVEKEVERITGPGKIG
jgi:DnaJ homolog subfamily C member 28